MANSEVNSRVAAGGPQPLRTVYVPLNHRHHERANVLYGLVGNPRESLPEVSTPEHLDFYHNVMKVCDPAPKRRIPRRYSDVRLSD